MKIVFSSLSFIFISKRQTNPLPIRPFVLSSLHDLMLPSPPTLTPHDQQAPGWQTYIDPLPCLLGFPCFPAADRAIKRLRELVEADRAGGKQTETHYRLSEMEILRVGGDAVVAGVFVDYAILRSLAVTKDALVDESLNQPFEFGRYGRCWDDLRFYGRRRGFRGHEAVRAAEVHGAAAEICSPGAF